MPESASDDATAASSPHLSPDDSVPQVSQVSQLSEEWFDVCDPHDNVIGRLPRSRVHAQRLLHRAVHVFVFNTRGELWLQLRSASKDESPLCYTSSASGHVSAGEEYDATAPRELEEELGLSCSLERLVKLPACPELANEHTVLYRAVTDAVPVPDRHEVEAMELQSLDEIARRIPAEFARFSPPFVTLFRWYMENGRR
jgi:isopentenyldiphosphate isomerase